MRPLETMVLIVQYDKIICFQNAYILFHLFISKYTLKYHRYIFRIDIL